MVSWRPPAPRRGLNCFENVPKKNCFTRRAKARNSNLILTPYTQTLTLTSDLILTPYTHTLYFLCPFLVSLRRHRAFLRCIMSDDGSAAQCCCLSFLALNLVGWGLYYVIASSMWAFGGAPPPLGGPVAGGIVVIFIVVIFIVGTLGAKGATMTPSSESGTSTSTVRAPLRPSIPDPVLVTVRTTRDVIVSGPGGVFARSVQYVAGGYLG